MYSAFSWTSFLTGAKKVSQLCPQRSGSSGEISQTCQACSWAKMEDIGLLDM